MRLSPAMPTVLKAPGSAKSSARATQIHERLKTRSRSAPNVPGERYQVASSVRAAGGTQALENVRIAGSSPAPGRVPAPSVIDQLRKLRTQMREFRLVVDDDVRIVRIVRHEVLMVLLGRVE